MKYNYATKGVCSRSISFEIEDDIVKNVEYVGGCNGNLQGISKLVEGRNINDVIEILSGIKCGFKQTSCPDQLSCALKKALKGEEQQ